ncbi:unnamed protein product [Ilex paraguariensis]|uniref:Uncharacterized protein n=1 Tax=Ilex paraguariensis TaxID=185542 RepID=A0ABC8R7B5_9AQUA
MKEDVDGVTPCLRRGDTTSDDVRGIDGDDRRNKFQHGTKGDSCAIQGVDPLGNAEEGGNTLGDTHIRGLDGASDTGSADYVGVDGMGDVKSGWSMGDARARRGDVGKDMGTRKGETLGMGGDTKVGERGGSVSDELGITNGVLGGFSSIGDPSDELGSSHRGRLSARIGGPRPGPPILVHEFLLIPKLHDLLLAFALLGA